MFQPGAECHTAASCDECGYGSGFRTTALTTLKMIVLPPIAVTSVRSATSVTTGVRAAARSARLNSATIRCNRPSSIISPTYRTRNRIVESMSLRSEENQSPPDCDAVRVWFCRTDELTQDDVLRLDALLSRDERQKRDRFVFEEDKRDYAVAHGLVRSALSQCGEPAPGEWQFDVSEAGKPYVTSSQAGSPPIRFNLSHTRGLVACAVVRGPEIGIDVERIARVAKPADIANRFFASSEIARLVACSATDYPTMFTELWTLKEAYLKALGTGLTTSLGSFAFDFDGEHGVRLIAQSANQWQFALVAPSPDSRLAIAFRYERPRPLFLHPTLRTRGDHAKILRHTEGIQLRGPSCSP